MEDNKKHIDEMQKLADEGWKQMHETLRQHGLTSDIVPGSTSKRKIFFLSLAACLVLFLTIYIPYSVNHNKLLNTRLQKNYSSSSSNSSSSTKTHQPVQSNSNAISYEDKNAEPLSIQQKILVHQKINNEYLKFRKRQISEALQNEKKYFLEKFLIEKPEPVKIQPCDNIIDSTIEIEKTLPVQKKTEKTSAKKVRIFAGAGINISPTTHDIPQSFNLKNWNVHPSVTVVIPLSQKFSIHTGLSAFSTISGKEVSTKEKELVTNLSPDVYYNIKTTSIVKASYFDLPITLHYSINKNWSVGSGLQLSRLNKVKIKEEKESFGYNNALYAATVDQYNASPMIARAAFQKKLEIKKIDPRFIVETNFEKGSFLFSAGYYYSLDKTIILKDGYNSSHEYRNEYFKLGLQYKICAGK
ncbi:MAG: outer membrane beta-barrel protein [Ginsengibacter sp.]